VHAGRCLLAAALGAVLALSAHARTAFAQPESGGGAGATTIRLDNGLTLVLLEDHTLPVVSLRIAYRTAPSPDGLNLIAPRLMLDATKHVEPGQYDAFLAAAGGRSQGWSATSDRATFTVTLPAHQVNLALWLWSDQMGFVGPRLDAAMLDRAKALALQNRRMLVDESPCGLSTVEMRKAMYPEPHPYHAQPQGPSDRALSASADELRDYLRSSFTPDRASLVLVGDFDTADMQARVSRWFGDIPAGPSPWTWPSDEMLPAASTDITLRANVDAARVFFQWRIPRALDSAFEWEALTDYLDGNASAFLRWELRDKQHVVDSIDASYSRAPLGSTFRVTARVAKGHSTADVVKAVGALVARVVAEGPNPVRVERAGLEALRARLVSRETTAGRAQLLYEAWLYGSPWAAPDGKLLDAPRAVALLRDAFVDEHRVVVRCEVDPGAPIRGTVAQGGSSP
jgi:predicted Zn-dependent peptidase